MLEEHQDNKLCLELNIDNQSIIALIKNGVVNRRLRHIDVKYRFVHDLVKRKAIKLRYCPSGEQKADILTKALNRIKFLTAKKPW